MTNRQPFLPAMPFALSLVVPLFNSVTTVDRLVEALAALPVPGGHELILVDDGSSDGTAERAARWVSAVGMPVTLVRLARNFGEHNAVLAGLKEARGRHVITLDDDLQNPPEEALRLWRHAVEGGFDVVYGALRKKRHPVWRNLGSWMTNRVAGVLLNKPGGLYLSSFRCLSAFVVAEVTRYEGPYVYLDGLLLQATASIDQIEVRHESRMSGRSGYTLRKLTHLWLNMVVNFSVMPLRLATMLGFGMAGLGFLMILWVVIEHWLWAQPLGWSSLMAVLLLFSGTQLVVVGVVGEYVGRIYLTVNQRPQFVVREVERGTDG
jgi:glycosyltransferase involved in cell wall biosynthesis